MKDHRFGLSYHSSASSWNRSSSQPQGNHAGSDRKIALVALIAAGRGHHCCSTSSDKGCRRLPRKIVDVKVDGGLLDFLQREGSVSVMHLPDEGELLPERVQQQIRVGVIEDFFSPMSARRGRWSSMVDIKSVGLPPDGTVVVNRFCRHARRVSFVFPSKRSFEAFHAVTPSPKQPTSAL